jgi:hypothetical protein
LKRVYLQNIEATTGGNLFARRAFATGLDRWPVPARAIERLGKNACRRGFADPTNPGKKKGMGDAPPLNGVFERTGNARLADHVLEDLRPPF